MYLCSSNSVGVTYLISSFALSPKLNQWGVRVMKEGDNHSTMISAACGPKVEVPRSSKHIFGGCRWGCHAVTMCSGKLVSHTVAPVM
jgi:hypothetical protein